MNNFSKIPGMPGTVALRDGSAAKIAKRYHSPIPSAVPCPRVGPPIVSACRRHGGHLSNFSKIPGMPGAAALRDGSAAKIAKRYRLPITDRVGRLAKRYHFPVWERPPTHFGPYPVLIPQGQAPKGSLKDHRGTAGDHTKMAFLGSMSVETPRRPFWCGPPCGLLVVPCGFLVGPDIIKTQ